MADVEDLAVAVQQRQRHFMLVPGRVDVPQPLRFPFLGERERAVLKRRGRKRLARQHDYISALIADVGAQSVAGTRIKALHRSGQRDLAASDRRVDLDAIDPRRAWSADEV